MPYRKKLIEVALPLDAINEQAAREKSIRHGHPSTIHLWWARRPLAACRAVLFGQLVDDPSSWPEQFPSEAQQDRERRRLFRIIEEYVKWENSDNATVLDAARVEIARSLARGRMSKGRGSEQDRAVLKDDVKTQSVRAYLAEAGPCVHDPFAGGGSIPLEAQRLGLRAIATDLNPVAVLISKALIEIPSRFAGCIPVGPKPESRKQKNLELRGWPKATGLAEDMRRYGAWMCEQAQSRLRSLYPDVDLPDDCGGGKATVLAWLWARTVESPNPAFSGVQVPLISNFFLSTKKGKQAWVEPIVDGRKYRFVVRTGKPGDPVKIKQGTKLGRGANFRCILSDTPISADYVKAQGDAGRVGQCMYAVVAVAGRKRVFLPVTPEMEEIATSVRPEFPDVPLPRHSQYVGTLGYGIDAFGKLFLPRQLQLLTTLFDLLPELLEKVKADALAAGRPDESRASAAGADDGQAYAEAIVTMLALAASKMAVFHTTMARWRPGESKSAPAFGRQAYVMVWDFPEVNPFAGAGGDFMGVVNGSASAIEKVAASPAGDVYQSDAAALRLEFPAPVVTCTDPPYFDNVPYADLSDYFYLWLRSGLRSLYPQLFGTMLVPKAAELVADRLRHGNAEAAEKFFLNGMERVLSGVAARSSEDFPVTIFYAFRQAERDEAGIASTGWEAFLEGVIRAGFMVVGTLPMRTEGQTRMRAMSSNALASSVALVCRRRSDSASTISRGDFRRLLKAELPGAISALRKGNVAPVDMAQAAIGPGMSIFTGHEKVVDADGSAMSVRGALQLINEVVDEAAGEDDGVLDADTRFAVTWYESYAYAEGPFGDADTLAKARNISVSGVQEAGVLKSAAGKVRLLTRDELPADWDPVTDARLTAWEATQHLIKRLEEQGEGEAATLLSSLGPLAEHARSLAYRLYATCERRGWAEEAQAYNGLVLAWPELEKLAGEVGGTGGPAPQAELFE